MIELLARTDFFMAKRGTLSWAGRESFGIPSRFEALRWVEAGFRFLCIRVDNAAG